MQWRSKLFSLYLLARSQDAGAFAELVVGLNILVALTAILSHCKQQDLA